MGNIQVNSNSSETGSMRQKISGVLDEMWTKIGLHHHSVDGDVKKKVKKSKEQAATDNENSLSYEINLPDMKSEDIAVEIDDGRLVVFGNHREQSKTVSEHYVSTEQTIRHFEQSFLLPEGVTAENASAKFKKGILTVTVPKKQESKEDG